MTGLSHHWTCHSNGGSVILIISFMRKSQTRAKRPKTDAPPTQFKLRVTMTDLSHHWTCHWSRRICFSIAFIHFHTRETNKSSITKNTRTTNTIQAQSNYDWFISSLDMPLKPKDMFHHCFHTFSYTRNKQELNNQKHPHHQHNSSSE